MLDASGHVAGIDAFRREEVVGPAHPRHVRIEAVSVAVPDHFLDDDRHLLVGAGSLRGANVTLRVAEVGGRIDELDGLHQLAEPGVRVRLVVGDHFRLVNPRERAKQRVLQQAR